MPDVLLSIGIIVLALAGAWRNDEHKRMIKAISDRVRALEQRDP